MRRGVLDLARSLTGSRYGMVTILDGSGGCLDIVGSSGKGDQTKAKALLFQQRPCYSRPVRPCCGTRAWPTPQPEPGPKGS